MKRSRLEKALGRVIEIHWAAAWQIYHAASALIHDRKPVSTQVACVTEAIG
jgi:hypothetical protein